MMEMMVSSDLVVIENGSDVSRGRMTREVKMTVGIIRRRFHRGKYINRTNVWGRIVWSSFWVHEQDQMSQDRQDREMTC